MNDNQNLQLIIIMCLVVTSLIAFIVGAYLIDYLIYGIGLFGLGACTIFITWYRLHNINDKLSKQVKR